MTARGPTGAGPGRDARDLPRDALRDSPLRRLLLLLSTFDLQHTELTLTELLLAVRDGDEVVFVEKFSAPGVVPVLSLLGRRRSMHASSSALVLLDHAEPELQERVLARPCAATPRSRWWTPPSCAASSTASAGTAMSPTESGRP